MPPCAAFKVPSKVIAPEVAVLGVNPVVPALNVVTAALPTEVQVGAEPVPLVVKT